MERIGFSKDIHKLVSDRKLMLGGIEIPFNKGEEAHSDGDVVIHAIAEAMLGAAALGDLGMYYPSNDDHYLNIASKEILLDVYNRIQSLGFIINNIDVSIELETPKLAMYIKDMKKNLASILHIALEQINIKVGTNEGMDATGHCEAVVAYAVVLLSK